MAKQRRANARPTPPTKSAKKKPARSAGRATIGGKTKSGASAPPPPPQRRSTFPEAVQIYERGLKALQAHQYGEAGSLLRTVIDRFPDEKELHERSQLYLNVCLRHIQPPDATPRTSDERVYAATLAINTGRYGDGISQLDAVLREAPNHDYALYMLGVALALRGDPAAAAARLRQSFELNPENVSLARRDPDLDSLRQDDSFRQVLDSLVFARRDSRSPGRKRS